MSWPGNQPSGPVHTSSAARPASSTLAPATYAPALKAGFQATTLRVQEMHQAISAKTFDHLLQVPGLSVPTRIVQGLHDAITQGVYAAVRHGGGAALTLAGEAERRVTDADRVPGAREQAARSAVNGVFGDALRDAGSALAIQMGLHAAGAPLALTPGALGSLAPRTCVFIHGLACDERSWALHSDAWQTSAWADCRDGTEPMQYGMLLAREFGLGSVYLRYNSGLSIESNAEQLNALLAEAAAAAPQVREWVLVGHSMGGLVARRAHALALQSHEAWGAATPMIVCLGSPHQGAPLETAGHALAAMLGVSDITKPLARVADARSQGIKDLRAGLKGKLTSVPPPALRMVFGTLGDEADTAGVGSLIGKVLGDGLVMPGSAADAGLDGDVERVELAGLGHMTLLNHPRVYALLRGWLGASSLTGAPDVARPG